MAHHRLASILFRRFIWCWPKSKDYVAGKGRRARQEESKRRALVVGRNRCKSIPQSRLKKEDDRRAKAMGGREIAGMKGQETETNESFFPLHFGRLFYSIICFPSFSFPTFDSLPINLCSLQTLQTPHPRRHRPRQRRRQQPTPPKKRSDPVSPARPE